MADDLTAPTPQETAVQTLRAELVQDGGARWRRILEKFVMAAIGSIPWVGGFLAAAASIPGDEAEVRKDHLRSQWLDEHQRKLDQLRATLDEVSDRFEKLGPAIEERVQS